MFKINKKNFIVLFAFAAGFSVVLGAGLMMDKSISLAETSESSPVVSTVTVTEPAAAASIDADAEAVTASVDTLGITGSSDDIVLSDVSYIVTEYDSFRDMYASDTVNVRAGAGTDYDRLGKISWGSAVQVIGETDNGWYEVSFNDGVGFVMGDYVTDAVPGTPYLFVGDSRTVQLKMAVGSSDKAYIAKVGEGYRWFKNTALSEIQEYAGSGTTMIINFGVNDLGNASKYISLVNSYIDTWTDAGITVYYAAVTPVGSSASVSNEQIESFNERLQAELDPRIQWIDGYSYLQQAGFNTSDGLHYDKNTYKSLYSYYMSVVSDI